MIHISPNQNIPIKRMDNIGIPLHERLLATLCHYHWIAEINSSCNRTLFKQIYENSKNFSLIPVTLKSHALPIIEDNLILGMEHKFQKYCLNFATHVFS